MATRETPSAPLLSALREAADASGRLNYADFSRLALYHPTEGYYRRERTRVGKTQGADFYTSVSVGSVFGRVIAEAARQLVTPGNPADFTLAEIGAEPEGGMFAGIETGFGELKSFPLGTDFQPDEHTVLVANEILDAQPFHRLEFHDGAWREWGVAVDGDMLREVLLDALSAPVKAQLADVLPEQSLPGYRLDIALEAESLVRQWAAGNWSGAMILIDYGKTWPELTTVTPQGTARAYYRHQQHNELLALPGHQDLTTHVCWDRIESALSATGFAPQPLQRQEAFIVKRSWAEIERLSADADARRELQSLIHPSGFGSKFQVLAATR
ncbi:SAM-dependent methyltransferase [Cerasicoccus fimbriatus]|uniref:SAM-dependent methyltransferase n=1 Tax=Cerasicoccus fimbriatus TaxID=3014554 RepID=UPI0022B3EDEE|nr:SAM-dependent methyltransferase [Cerasicoccus sp. TK19100]